MRDRPQQQGYALILVLWIVVLLSAVTLLFQSSARTETRLLALDLNASEARAIAEAGVWLGAQSIVADARGARTAQRPRELDIEFEGHRVQVLIRDVSGLINLNLAAANLLDSAFAGAGLDVSERTRIVNAILDWRDVDTDARNGGPEPQSVETAWGMVPVRNGLFATVDELRSIPGMTDAVYRQVRDRFTVYGSHRRINLNAAPRQVLAALPGADDETVDAYLAERTLNSPANNPITSGANRRLLQNTGEGIFSVSATAVIGDVSVNLSPIIRIPRRPDEEILVLSWGGDAS